ncbi:MAG: dienelactone hydrolase family protein [Alphaproteobacteria bacterium]
MAGQMISIKTKDGAMGGYFAQGPGKAPGVVVIQEIFGVNAGIRAICDRLASQGFSAIAPDLFWRIEKGVELSADKPEEFQRAIALMGKFDQAKGVDDIQASIATLRKDSTGKVGAVGYCLGGLLAYLVAARTHCDASVGYYGVNIDQKLGEAKNIKKPLMLHIAEADGFVGPDAQKRIKDGLAGNKLVTIHSYPGADHGFARVGGAHTDKKNADLADGRTLDFFKKNLA